MNVINAIVGKKRRNVLPAISRQNEDDLLFPRNRYSAFLRYRNAGRRWEAKVFEGRFFCFVGAQGVSNLSLCDFNSN